jgi:heme-degrading monooxygenase HmoA
MPSPTNARAEAGAFFRIDRFLVPQAARAEFLSRVLQTHRLLADQPGFLGDHVVERAAASDANEIVTIAVWESEEAVVSARKAVQAMHKAAGFDPGSLFHRLEIKAEIGNYAPVSR